MVIVTFAWPRILYSVRMFPPFIMKWLANVWRRTCVIWPAIWKRKASSLDALTEGRDGVPEQPPHAALRPLMEAHPAQSYRKAPWGVHASQSPTL